MGAPCRRTGSRHRTPPALGGLMAYIECGDMDVPIVRVGQAGCAGIGTESEIWCRQLARDSGSINGDPTVGHVMLVGPSETGLTDVA